MIVDALTTFPHIFDSVMGTSIMGRAQEAGLLEFRAHDLRDWTHDRHRTTDDEIYGGGQGLLMKAGPILEALDDIEVQGPKGPVIFFSPAGTPFSQAIASRLSTCERIVLVCGHYEGIDERAYSRASLVLSIGDYVLTGGELAAMVLTDAVARLIPGVLGDEASNVDESFGDGLLEYPQYTRPASCREMDVPPVLLSGDHGKVAQWKRRRSIERTARLRPDMLASAPLTEAERAWVASLPQDVLWQDDEGFIDYMANAVRGGRP